MGSTIQLTATDDFQYDAYLAEPDGKAIGNVVVIQEIFGVNAHIREVCDGYAAEGYRALAPALFDRAERHVELGYDADGMTNGVDFARNKLDMPKTLQDVQAAIRYLGEHGPVAMVGYCFGGLVCWLSAANLEGLNCVSSYYGGGIAGMVDLQPKVPTQLHFGDQDAHIPLTDVDAIKEAHPEVTVHVYNADHGFNCDHRGSYNEAAASQAKSRTLEFFKANLG
ncbi:MAG: carboxymethylenebutenolidase [Candidatus Azotimanducaceae bacterium]|jgi:carboxymethylenebutenolidase